MNYWSLKQNTMIDIIDNSATIIGKALVGSAVYNQLMK